MNKIISGNLDQQIKSHPETKGWFLGHFMNQNPEFLCNDVELKWARHKKGEKKNGLFAKNTAKTLTILISGKFSVQYPELKQEIILSELGDFVLYDASQTGHKAEAIEDSLLLIIRYPSQRKI